MPAMKREGELDRFPRSERFTSWALVGLAIMAVLGAFLRIVGPATDVTQRLDQTTLLYLAVAAGLLSLKKVKVFRIGQLKLEMIEKIGERQDRQEQRLADIALILPLLLPPREVGHIKALASGASARVKGSHAVRTELRRLASLHLVARKGGHHIEEVKNEMDAELGDYVELTDLGRQWALRIQEIEAAADRGA